MRSSPRLAVSAPKEADTADQPTAFSGRVVRAAIALLAFFLSGCGRPAPTPVEALEELRDAFPETASADAGATTTDPVRLAISAAQAQEYDTGVVAMEAAKTVPGLSAGQLAAIENARQAITADLVRRADSGDAKAKAQLKAIEQARSQ